jgi:hypothetical protein
MTAKDLKSIDVIPVDNPQLTKKEASTMNRRTRVMSGMLGVLLGLGPSTPSAVPTLSHEQHTLVITPSRASSWALLFPRTSTRSVFLESLRRPYGCAGGP